MSVAQPIESCPLGLAACTCTREDHRDLRRLLAVDQRIGGSTMGRLRYLNTLLDDGDTGLAGLFVKLVIHRSEP